MEFIFKTIFWTLAFYGLFEITKNIIFSDLESTDNTEEIVKKLSEEYECLKVISWKECKDIIDNVDQN